MSENFPNGFSILQVTNLIGVVRHQIIMISFGYSLSGLCAYNEIHNEKDNKVYLGRKAIKFPHAAEENVAS